MSKTLRNDAQCNVFYEKCKIALNACSPIFTILADKCGGKNFQKFSDQTPMTVIGVSGIDTGYGLGGYPPHIKNFHK